MSELLFPIVESLCLELQLKKAADPDQHAHEMMDAQANKRMPSSSKEEALPIVKRRKIAREGSQPEFQATVENEGRQPRLPTTAEKESSPDTAQQQLPCTRNDATGGPEALAAFDRDEVGGQLRVGQACLASSERRFCWKPLPVIAARVAEREMWLFGRTLNGTFAQVYLRDSSTCRWGAEVGFDVVDGKLDLGGYDFQADAAPSASSFRTDANERAVLPLGCEHGQIIKKFEWSGLLPLGPSPRPEGPRIAVNWSAVCGNHRGLGDSD